MNFGLNFQPGVDRSPAEQQSTTTALGPGQRALKILAMHLPKMAGANVPRGTSPQGPRGLSPDAAVFQALVQSLQGAPPGGFPTTAPLVETFGNLAPEHTPDVSGSVNETPTQPDAGPAGNFLGPNGEWLPGVGELAPPAPLGGVGNSNDIWHSLMSSIGGRF